MWCPALGTAAGLQAEVVVAVGLWGCGWDLPPPHPCACPNHECCRCLLIHPLQGTPDSAPVGLEPIKVSSSCPTPLTCPLQAK